MCAVWAAQNTRVAAAWYSDGSCCCIARCILEYRRFGTTQLWHTHLNRWLLVRSTYLLLLHFTLAMVIVSSARLHYKHNISFKIHLHSPPSHYIANKVRDIFPHAITPTDAHNNTIRKKNVTTYTQIHEKCLNLRFFHELQEIKSLPYL